MKRNHLFVPLTLISAVCAIAADQTADDGKRAETPVLGYRYSSESKELRALLGVPGSSRWSEAIAGLPEGIASLRIAPGHTWALVLRSVGENDFETGILTLDTGAYKRLGGGMSLDRVVFSPSGSAVVILGESTSVVFSGLPAAPSDSREAALSEGATAVSDAGVVAAVAAGRLLRGGEGVADCADCLFAFAPGADTLAVFAKSSGELFEYAAGATEPRRIAGDLGSADSLYASANGVMLVETAVRVRLLDTASGDLLREEALSSAAASPRLEPLRHTGALLIATEDGGASWMFSSGDGVKVIPAAAAAAAQKVQE